MYAVASMSVESDVPKRLGFGTTLQYRQLRSVVLYANEASGVLV